MAQRLLVRAWDDARDGSETPRPWPWADTWPVGRLRSPRQDVDLIVLDGAAGSSLAFAPGRHTGASPVGAAGHVVIAGHRDTHFRFLRDLRPGDPLLLEDRDGRLRRYWVRDRRVVDEHDGWVLAETGEPTLTLITCFPFDSPVPGGPGRFVVRAVAEAPGGEASI